MIKKIYKVITWLIIVIGCLHVSITFFTYQSLSPEAVWFAGAGLAVIFAGFLNLVFLRSKTIDHFVQKLSFIANLTLSVVFILLLLIFPAPHLFVGAAAFIAAAFFTIRPGKIIEV